jgi:sulfonate transport system substrate-binding protein
MKTSRRRILGWMGAGTAAVIVGRSARAAQTIHIGYQKYGLLVLLKARGVLEPALAAKGWSVAWSEFPGGIQLVEAFQAGKLDFGVVGEAPPIFALAGGAPVVYLGAEPPAPAAEALLVPKASTVARVSDLAGKQIVVNKGSNAHYLLIRALAEAKVPYDKVKITFVPPAGARAAFEAGQVDAWSIWDPFFASAQQAAGARVLRDGKGLVENSSYYLGARDFAQTHAAIVDLVLEQIRQTGAWVNANRGAAAELLAPLIGIDKPALATALARSPFGLLPVSDQVLASQQQIADTFHALKLIPNPIRVADARWNRATSTITRR